MKKALLLLLVAASLGACKKNDDNAPRSNTDLLTARNWRLSAETTTTVVNNNPPKTTDSYASAAACERDDFLKFNADHSITSDEGPVLCNPADPQTQTGTWKFENDEAKLTITDPTVPGPGQTFDVISLSASTMRLHGTATYSFGGVTAVATVDETLTAF
ncbi:MAG: lipocalin family protein [Janthinobacterium lividum]